MLVTCDGREHPVRSLGIVADEPKVVGGAPSRLRDLSHSPVGAPAQTENRKVHVGTLRKCEVDAANQYAATFDAARHRPG